MEKVENGLPLKRHHRPAALYLHPSRDTIGSHGQYLLFLSASKQKMAHLMPLSLTTIPSSPAMHSSVEGSSENAPVASVAGTGKSTALPPAATTTTTEATVPPPPPSEWVTAVDEEEATNFFDD